MKHTKGKLEVIHELNVQSNINREFIATCGCNGRDLEENKANAKRIVKCWNNFDELLEVCKKVNKLLIDIKTFDPTMFNGRYIQELEQAITEAGEE